MITTFRGDYYFLSNMYLCPVTFNGITYRCVESAFQAQKDPSRAMEFKDLNGFEARRLGRRVKLRKDWQAIKLNLMLVLVCCKFDQNPYLQEYLRATGDKKIVEMNSWGDTYWGVDLSLRGSNNLGNILMLVRGELD